MDNAAKQELRKKLLASRPHSSQGLTQQLINILVETNAKTIASYSPLPTEPDVAEFNRLAGSSARVVYPRVSGETLEFAAGEKLAGALGILEPSGPAVALSDIELMLVPALAVDRAGNRLGKGKGFYDRVLDSFRGLRVAVVFEGEIVESVPHEMHDQRVGMVVTPSQTVVVD